MKRSGYEGIDFFFVVLSGIQVGFVKFGFVMFCQEKRQQLLTEIRTLCEAPCYQGLVEFYGAFYTPDSGQISITLEYMDGGSLADVIKRQRCIPEPVLSLMVQKLLQVSTLFCVFYMGSFFYFA